MTSKSGPHFDRQPPSRDILPIPDRPYLGVRPVDARDPAAQFPPIEQLRPPAGAPNVLVILLDDVGFGASAPFGGPINTPTLAALAGQGLKYSRFHTTALCSPTRAALLTGRNHHTVGFAAISEVATSAPGYTGIIPNHCAPLAKVLRYNGYATAQFGKCHEIPAYETSAAGPFDRWPTGQGFEYFYGFVGGETNQYYPAIYEGTSPIEPDRTPEQGYHFTEDMTDKTIAWMQQQKALAPDKPFFAYYAPGACHAPLQVPGEWSDKYKGKFAQGWDKVRETTFAAQKALGIIPPEAELTARPAEIPAWDDMPADLKPVLERQMEVYAGFLEHTDCQVGRVIDALREMAILDDTLVIYIVGDNGASAEGTLNGTMNELLIFNAILGEETPESMKAGIDAFGGPDSFGHYSFGWAHAMCTPYQWTKQVAGHWGGTRNAAVVHWPGGIAAKGEVRHQFHHVIDIAPTVLEAAGLPQPTLVDGVMQTPIHGTSMLYSFDAPKAPERHTTQYFEIFCNRGIYHQGWVACTLHTIPWEPSPRNTLEGDEWELYDTNTDWTEARNVAAEFPDQLKELQTLFLLEAERYLVTPLDDRKVERFNATLAGRPELIKGNRQILFPGMKRLSENSVINIKNRSHAVTADIIVPDGTPGHGTIIAQGGKFGGWALYMIAGKLKYCYNFMDLGYDYIESAAPLAPGERRVRVEFAYDGGGLAKGGLFTLWVDGEKVGEGRIERSVQGTFSLDETLDIGHETGTIVAEDLRGHDSHFNGRIRLVQLDTGLDDKDHFLSPEERMRLALARQ